MVTDVRVTWKRPVVPLAAASLLGLILRTPSALAERPVRGPAQEVGSEPAGPPAQRSGSSKAPAQGSVGKPDGAGNFVYELINQIQVQSKELCARYGDPSDCLEEAEVCLTMHDTEDNTVRLCLNTTPGESEGNKGTVQKSRVRRTSR
jgi:hypothetical protein